MTDLLDWEPCPVCGHPSPIEVYPDEKPDGSVLGHTRATCPECGHEWTEDEIGAAMDAEERGK